MTKLKKLYKLSPRLEKAINIVGTVLSGVGLELGQDQAAPQSRAGQARRLHPLSQARRDIDALRGAAADCCPSSPI
jgi:hypothetical protein